MQGGYIERLSDDVGIVGPFAYTKTDTDATFSVARWAVHDAKRVWRYPDSS